MRGISKRVFLESCTCLTRGWFLRHVDSCQPLSEAEEFRLNRGNRLGNWLGNSFRRECLSRTPIRSLRRRRPQGCSRIRLCR